MATREEIEVALKEMGFEKNEKGILGQYGNESQIIAYLWCYEVITSANDYFTLRTPTGKVQARYDSLTIIRDANGTRIEGFPLGGVLK